MDSRPEAAVSVPCPRFLNLAGFNEDAAENILENRRRFLKLFPGEWALAGCWQVHGADVRRGKNLNDARPAEDARGETVYCDAIVSDAPGVMAGVKTADCVPILIGDAKTGAFAAVSGLARHNREVAIRAVERMIANSQQAPPHDYSSRLVPQRARAAMKLAAKSLTRSESTFHPRRRSSIPTRKSCLVDLIKANRAQLVCGRRGRKEDLQRDFMHDVSH